MILNLTELKSKIKSHRQENLRVGLITGCFDILHAGHLHLFSQARKHVDLLVVGLESDAYIRSRKGELRPVNPIVERITLVDALKYVDYTFAIPEIVTVPGIDVAAAYAELLADLAPSHYITVAKRDKLLAVKQDINSKLEIELVTIDLVDNDDQSTTKIIEKIKNFS